MNDILEEIKSDLKAEALTKLVSKYGKIILLVSLAIILSVSVYVYMDHRFVTEQERVSVDYHKALVSGDIDTFIKSHKKNAYVSLAILRDVDTKISNRKPEEALKMLVSLIESTEQNEISTFAKIRFAQTSLSYKLSNNYRASIGFLEKSLSKNESMGHLIKFLIAQIKLELKETDQAKALLMELNNNKDVPENIKFFANVMLHSI